MIDRFPRRQKAIAATLNVADATLLTDNSRQPAQASTVCWVQITDLEIYNIRAATTLLRVISMWLDGVRPLCADAGGRTSKRVQKQLRSPSNGEGAPKGDPVTLAIASRPMRGHD